MTTAPTRAAARRKPKRPPTEATRALAIVALAAAPLGGCFARPPASQLPSAQAALDRLRDTGRCALAVQAGAKVDQFRRQGRVRLDLLLFAQKPANLRMDVLSPLGGTLATLTSDGAHFTLSDLRDKRVYVGPSSACNIARFTTVTVPGYVLVDLLVGQAPVLKRASEPMTGGRTGSAAALSPSESIAWSGRGYYVVRIAGTRDANEEIHLAPHPDDVAKPWREQRMRLLDVKVEQRGGTLYHAELTGHRATTTAPPRVDPDGIEPPIPPSGPACDAEIPRAIHVEVPGEADVLFRYDDVRWNPPLPAGTFTQPPSDAMPTVPVNCD